MKRIFDVILITVLLLTISLIFSISKGIAGALVKDLRCEYARNPLGIDTPKPRLTWIIESDTRGEAQTAYRIIVASSKEGILAGRDDLWDTGKVDSEKSSHIEYRGATLRSGMECWWKVKIWDKDGKEEEWSEPACWTMGVLSQSDWKAEWIGSPLPDSTQMPIFRKTFRIQKPVRKATVAISGLGHYEMYLNGKKTGDNIIDPGWTNYRRTCLYSTYDITGQLVDGVNVFGIFVGNGMYNVPGGRYIKFKGSFGLPKVILQAVIVYQDGTTETIITDEQWKCIRGPIVFSCVYGGEDYDARLEPDNWLTSGFDDSAWDNAVIVDGPGGELRAQTAPPVKVIKTLKPVRITEPKTGIIVYDFGRNFSGIPKISVRGKKGSTVKMTPAELLDENGMATQKWSGGPSYFTYTLKGQGIETWYPRFTYYGFRYIRVEGAVRKDDGSQSEAPILLKIEGQFVHNSAEKIGEFSCSNELFNKIHAIILASIRSNMQSVLTDCPHREKLGWLEQAHLMGPSVMLDYFVPGLYGKIMRDMMEAQLENGLVPDIAPEYVVFNEGFRDSPEWGSAFVIAPWYIYERFGDIRLLEEYYPYMRKYVDYLISTANEHIVSHGLGDWCDFGPKPYGKAQNTPIPLTATTTYYYDIKILEKAASLLGKTQESTRLSRLADEVNNAFQKKYFNPETKQYATGSQTSNSMPLAFGMVPREHEASVLNNIINDIRKHTNNLTGGDIGHRFLVQALHKFGRSDVLFDMTSQTDVPSYGSQVMQGATALTEVWDPSRGFSQNHFMMGHIEEWFYEGLGGINFDPEEPAYKHIIIKPEIVGDLNWVECSYRTIYGKVSINWKRNDDGTLLLNCKIPANTRATVLIPAKSPEEITESSIPLKDAPGILRVERENDRLAVHVSSGGYSFLVSN